MLLFLMVLPLLFLLGKQDAQSSHLIINPPADVKVKSTSPLKLELGALSDYLKRDNITGEFLTSVQAIQKSTLRTHNLLDIAVIGFAKSGTSTLKQWLDLHPQIT